MDLLPKVFRTEGDLADFDSSRILNSIIKETGLDEKEASKITELVVRRIISSGIKFLSGPHIREIVCSILSEHHFENERKLYTRIGMPLMDYEEILEKGPSNKLKKNLNPEKVLHWAANRIAEEYAHLRILSDEESRAHLYGDIHIHKLKYFDLRPLHHVWDPRIILKYGIPPLAEFIPCCKLEPAKSLKEAIHHLVKWLYMVQNEFCGNQGFNLITTFLAPYAKGLSEEKIQYAIKEAIFEINQLSAIVGRKISPISLLNSPTILKEISQIPAVGPYGKVQNIYGDYYDECLKLCKSFTLVFKQGDNNKKSFKTPKHEILIAKNWFDQFKDVYAQIWEEVELMQSPYLRNLCFDSYRNKFLNNLIEDSYSNFGILQDISLNLPRYAYNTRNEEEFIETLKSKLNLCAEILLKKYTIIKRRLYSNHLPLCSGRLNDEFLFNLENQGLSISFVGLNEVVKFFTNSELHESSDAFNFGKKILIEMNKSCQEFSKKYKKNFIISENISRKAPVRFATLDLKHFSKIVLSQFRKQKQFYTNSAHIREDAEIGLEDKLKLQEDFHLLIQHGATEYVSLNELKNNNIELIDFVKKIFPLSKIACIKFIS
ncbi:MAG: anaerobic ribonucleoside-triphosphate reductase [Promethearchaeota archaeon]